MLMDIDKKGPKACLHAGRRRAPVKW